MKAVVTGGGGFLGGAVVRLLRQRGDSVRSFTRSAYPWLDELGVEQSLGNLSDLESVERAVSGCDVVFHVAAKAGVWGRYSAYYSTNVVGTQNVIAACKTHGVRRLVYTSTPSVVHAGGDNEGANESLPYPKHFDAAYPETKAKAEKAVLAANGSDLATVSLRPHLIFGPGDPHLIPRIIDSARAGKLKRIGNRPAKVDVTYIDNAAQSQLDAADRLDIGTAPAGKAYFISNGEPVELWPFVDRILAEAGLPPVTARVSAWKARLAGRVLESVYWLFRLPGEPPMTRFVANQMSTSHWYDISAARRDLGYEPKVSVEEGLRRLGERLRLA
ncbi:3 beta-hydroxysteroid dehydrogenase/Delta 5--_4-isomerase [Gemmata obscuriglobus]|uniref:3-beta hydroxysteroid dehydrogenase n=1 Tax=Gemmata obscuriglobus TaxID=114 RepID=A0A2Z3H6T4_9BACT|nr:NAD-dependent epimerase/dehydratase family protein [Gemmata obscuriglobus]AWM41478.1 3-beta hydroxysteroid dehydrogenase [Gemmata obscuriglobus]QEG32615.1 3 beta-hydroxysteroid dehydrogenase/Delta 5-->4-isomerase [Gemmata obscuriglobus]VTS11971.1 3-beta hydroxysteroid dehydrogenase : 3-beta-hydroxysteroid dehydrogenase/isomerase family protein OS=Geobacter bemidjiensis (strain Bem / ATCC BAA-1014 / DSM 16622) GN=Gbem_2099 PE=4 SV=1: 3Beta_HSD [Gemmata obscuriglobus UQM 2246]